jgi:hypothetical protein
MRSLSFPVLASLVLLTGLTLSTPAWAGMTLSGAPKVSFFAQGSPGFLDIEGVTNTMQVADDGTTITFTVPMSTVSTGIGLRDDHMNNEFVQVAKFPNAVLSINKADIPWPANVGEAAKGTAAGTFTIHGVSNTTQVTYTAKKSKAGYHVTASFPFDIGQHGISVPSYLGITVAPAMRAEVTLDLASAG